MGVRITSEENVVALFDSVSGWAFGPTLHSVDEAEAFLRFTERESDGVDLRSMSNSELETYYTRFRAEEWDEE